MKADVQLPQIFVFPDALQPHSSIEAEFHTLADVLENSDGQYQMQYGHR